ncbi:hypothetical protein [Actinomadura rupiterrae]|uniref:hypothetical protein n=1 Tax=Actinomadura rupiterrae TaxID=559627 RepID=UPI0020A3155C|nr:hypothetical protein [Actinomadura rupiterrae]MCP2341182.1 hypothetical protein [Actinomadura rupiterrae]
MSRFRLTAALARARRTAPARATDQAWPSGEAEQTRPTGRIRPTGRTSPAGRRSRRGLLAALGVSALLATAGAAVGTAAARPGEGAPKPPAPRVGPSLAKPSAKVVKTANVTLVTGDRFRVDVSDDGSQQAAPLGVGGKPAGAYAQFGYNGDTYVIPAKAVPYLGTVLDPRLFDVGYLVRAKLDDAHARSLPVTVKASAADAEALPGTSVTSSSGGTVRAKVTKKDAAGLGRLLSKNWRTARDKGGPAALSGVTSLAPAVPSGAPALPSAPTLVGQPEPKAQSAGVRFRNLTVDAIDQDGKPGVMVGFVHNVDDVALGSFGMDYPGNGKRAFSIPEGTYSIEASVFTGPGDDPASRAALVVEPEVTVKADTTVVLDARKAVQYKTDLAAPPKAGMPRIDFMSFLRTDTRGNETGVPPNGIGALLGFYNMRLGSAVYNGYPNLYATPTKPVTKGALHFVATTSLSSGTEDAIGSGPTYKMVLPAEGAIPANLTRALAASDFSTVHSHLRNKPWDDPSGGPVGFFTIAFLPWSYLPVGFSGNVPTGDRTDYLYSSAPDQVVWEWGFNPDKGERLNDLRRTLKPGQVVRQEFAGWPLTPSIAADYLATTGFDLGGGGNLPGFNDAVAQACAACRQGDLGALFLKGGADADPTHHYYYNPLDGNRLRFYRDGALAADSASNPNAFSPDPANLPMLPRAAGYRLIWNLTEPATPDAPVTTDWTFRSAPGDPAATLPQNAYCGVDTTRGCSFLPLLFVNYDLKLDDDSRAKAGQPFDIGFRVSHQQYQAAPAGVTATVEVSYDDGATWSKPADATQADGVFHATITHPAFDQDHRWVSLRVTAHDADGSSVTQTNVHAYRLDG